MKVGKAEFEVPGFVWAMAQQCCTGADGKPQLYSDRLDRVASGDEVLVACSTQLYGVVPKGMRRACCQKLDGTSNITCFAFCTFFGVHLPDHFIFQGKTVDGSKVACPAGSYLCYRDDGYFITWHEFKGVLQSLATCIPGAARP